MRFFRTKIAAQHVAIYCVAALLFFSLPAHAVTIEKPLPSAAQEATAQASFHALRCVVCEGQSVADSDATFAAQMRAEIRRMAADGETEQQILDHFTAHYGTRILLNPPLEPDTLALFAIPLLALFIGAIWIQRITRKRAFHG